MALVVISGIIGVAGANSNYYASIKRIGMARSANLALIQPFAAGSCQLLHIRRNPDCSAVVFRRCTAGGCALIISIRNSRQENPATSRKTVLPTFKRPDHAALTP